jgi:hypothetical protein
MSKWTSEEKSALRIIIELSSALGLLILSGLFLLGIIVTVILFVRDWVL